MKNLYVSMSLESLAVNHGASGLQAFQQLDVSTGLGCINRTLRFTSR
jgi:hypothetical protein